MKVAIFDFDQTITNNFFSVDIMMEMDKKKLLKPGYSEFIKDLLGKYDKKEVSYNDGANQEFAMRAKCLDGMSVLELVRFMEDEYNLDKYINAWVKPLFELLYSKGFLIIVISGALENFLEVVQEKLGFDSYFGSRVGVNQGDFVDSPELFMNDDQKAKVVRQIVKDSDFSIGFGDSTGDIKMLELMDSGFLYQPKDEAIAAIKDKKNISIVDEKNIIEAVEKIL